MVPALDHVTFSWKGWQQQRFHWDLVCKFTGDGLQASLSLPYIQTNLASVRVDLDLRRNPAWHWTPREWMLSSLKHIFLTPYLPSCHYFIPSTLYPQALTEGMYFRRDPWWCDGHESPVWNGNLHILPCQGDPGISQQRWWKEMEQVKKQSSLLRFSFQKHK